MYIISTYVVCIRLVDITAMIQRDAGQVSNPLLPPIYFNVESRIGLYIGTYTLSCKWMSERFRLASSCSISTACQPAN